MLIRALTLIPMYLLLLAVLIFAGPLAALCVSYLLLVLLLPTSPGRQRHRPWLPPPAPGLTGAAVLRGAAAPGDSLGRAASAATGTR